MTEPTSDPDVVAALNDVGGRIDECRLEIGREGEARKALATATDLQTAAIREQVELLREKHRLAGRALRRTNLFAAVLAVLLVVTLGLYVQQRSYVDQREEDRVAGAVASCQSANATRRAFVDYIDKANTSSFDALFAAFATLTPATSAVEDAARQSAALDRLRSSFAEKRQASPPPILGDRDCTPAAVTQPTVPPAATTTGG